MGVAIVDFNKPRGAFYVRTHRALRSLRFAGRYRVKHFQVLYVRLPAAFDGGLLLKSGMRNDPQRRQWNIQSPLEKSDSMSLPAC